MDAYDWKRALKGSGIFPLYRLIKLVWARDINLFYMLDIGNDLEMCTFSFMLDSVKCTITNYIATKEMRKTCISVYPVNTNENIICHMITPSIKTSEENNITMLKNSLW